MDQTRRNLLLHTILGGSLLGLRSAASGLPLWLLTADKPAGAQTPTTTTDATPQFLVLSTSQAGDPLNCNAPGSYEHAEIWHPSDPRMAPVDIESGGRLFKAAAPWATLSSDTLARTAFIHHSTETEQHLHQPDVHGLMGRVRDKDMLVSAYAAQLAQPLGTVQSQPIVIGTTDTSEAITYQGRTQPLLNPTALATVLVSQTGPLRNLQQLRDQDLDRLNRYFKAQSTPAQRRFLDRYATSQDQARSLEQDLLGQLSSISDNGPDGQVAAAVVLVKLRVAPVITIRVPFGGDNHFDDTLEQETEETLSGIATLVKLQDLLQTAGLADQVTTGSFNVFGRTLLRDGPGRSHNRNHHLTLLIGPHVRGGVYGGLERQEKDFGALPIHSTSGEGSPDGDISTTDSLASVGKTLGRTLGLSPEQVDQTVVVPSSGETVGRTIEAVLRA